MPALGERRAFPILTHRIVGRDEEPVGEIALETQPRWGYHVSFGPGASVPIRALTIAYVVSLVQQRTTVSSL